MVVADPIVSQAISRRTRQLARVILRMASESERATLIGRPSGTAATTMTTASMKYWRILLAVSRLRPGHFADEDAPDEEGDADEDGHRVPEFADNAGKRLEFLFEPCAVAKRSLQRPARWGARCFSGPRRWVRASGRGSRGEPADDVTALAINYIFFSLKNHGDIRGAYRQGLELFFKEYIRASADEEITKVVAPFFAFRAAVVANPIFYPELSQKAREKIFLFADSVLSQR